MKSKTVSRYGRLKPILDYLHSISDDSYIAYIEDPKPIYGECTFRITKFAPFSIFIKISASKSYKAGEYSKCDLYYGREYRIDWYAPEEGIIDTVLRSNLPNFIRALYKYHIMYKSKY